MKSLFQDYRFALLDASLFTCKLSESLRYSLEGIRTFAVETFDAEVTQYLQILPEANKDVFIDNLRFLEKTMRHERMNLRGFETDAPNCHSDIWGVLNCLVKRGMNFVLITADQLLVQRVVLENLKVDIYALNQECTWNTKAAGEGLIRYRDFAAYRSKFELVEDLSWPAGQKHEFLLEKNVLLYRKHGSPVMLGAEIASGAEAHIFRVQGVSGLAAKIFKKGKLPANKYANIKAIQGANSVLDVPWALFPIDVLYYDPACKIPAGFTEGLAKSMGDLDEYPLYMGDLDIASHYLDAKITRTLEICIQIVRQTMYLNVYGFLLSDFNAGNFAMIEGENDTMQMWDTDSFGYNTFFSGFYSGNQTSREYDISHKLGAVGFCNEQLYLLIFSLLSLGDYPINEMNGKYKYANPQYHALFRRNFFPENLWDLFDSVFCGEKDASVAMLLHELNLALDRYRENNALDKSYNELMIDLFGEYRKEDPPDPHPPMPEWAITLLVALGVFLAAFLFAQL